MCDHGLYMNFYSKLYNIIQFFLHRKRLSISSVILDSVDSLLDHRAYMCTIHRGKILRIFNGGLQCGRFSYVLSSLLSAAYYIARRMTVWIRISQLDVGM